MLAFYFLTFEFGAGVAFCFSAMVPIRAAFLTFSMGAALFAQSPVPNDQPHSWRRAEPADEQQQIAAVEQPDAPLPDQAPPNRMAPPPPPRFTSNPSFAQSAPAGQMGSPMGASTGAMSAPSGPAAPARLTVRPGTFITVRANQWLSSDHNQQGDTFFAVLAEPLIVDGVVVAQRGQTVTGRVTDAKKAGRAEGTSHLGLELTSLTLVDGQQVQLHSDMVGRNGDTSVGRDVAAVGTTTALGAAIGAGVDWGRGAAIGAGAGAAAGLLGVLLTRGHATEVAPETPITFRIGAPIEIATDRAPQAFHYADQRDYGQGGGGGYASVAPRRVLQPAPAPYYYSPYYYTPYYSPYYYGSGLSFYFGRGYGYGYGYRGGYYGGGRGFRR